MRVHCVYGIFPSDKWDKDALTALGATDIVTHKYTDKFVVGPSDIMMVHSLGAQTAVGKLCRRIILLDPVSSFTFWKKCRLISPSDAFYSWWPMTSGISVPGLTPLTKSKTPIPHWNLPSKFPKTLKYL